jgi:hypothetical protein
MKSDIQSFRELLPISSGVPVMAHMPLRIVRRPLRGALTLTRFVISNMGTEGGARDWVINDIEVDGISLLEVKDLSGALFTTRGVVARGRRSSSCLYSGEKNKYASSCIYFRGLVIERESEVAVTVTYVGSNPYGCPLFAAIVGEMAPQRPTVLPIATKNKLLPAGTATIAVVLDRPLEIGMLEIEDPGTDGGAADWVINDIRIDGTSQFTRPGKIPGDLFATDGIESFVKFHPGTRIELVVTYIGLNESGCCFVAHLLGTVVRDDLQQPPPDVRAIIRTSGQAIDEEIVAHCDWRPLYEQPGT